MSNDKPKKKYTKVGAVLKSDKSKGVFIVLGNSNASNEKYRTTVELTVKDASGKVVKSISNGLLTVLDPRKRPGIKEEELEKISDKLVNELFIVEEA